MAQAADRPTEKPAIRSGPATALRNSARRNPTPDDYARLRLLRPSRVSPPVEGDEALARIVDQFAGTGALSPESAAIYDTHIRGRNE